MAKRKFKLGEIVLIDPLERSTGHKGKVIGIIHMIDGTTEYLVSKSGLGGLSRHILPAYEICHTDPL